MPEVSFDSSRRKKLSHSLVERVRRPLWAQTAIGSPADCENLSSNDQPGTACRISPHVNVPTKVVRSLKALARHRRRSMEQGVRELPEAYIAERRSVLQPRRFAIAPRGAGCERLLGRLYDARVFFAAANADSSISTRSLTIRSTHLST